MNLFLFSGGGRALESDAPAPVGRDADVIDDVIGRLVATRQFGGVFWGEPVARRGRPADLATMALVEPDAWTEVVDYDDLPILKNTFTLTLFSRDPDPRTRDRRLDRLLNVAKNALNEQSLADITISGYTILRRGKWRPAASPERSMTVVGEYAYFVDSADAHDTLD